MEWQPIETAPKDGTWFLGAYDIGVLPTRWHVAESYEDFVTPSIMGRPHDTMTDWMPFPDPPKKNPAEAG